MTLCSLKTRKNYHHLKILSTQMDLGLLCDVSRTGLAFYCLLDVSCLKDILKTKGIQRTAKIETWSPWNVIETSRINFVSPCPLGMLDNLLKLWVLGHYLHSSQEDILKTAMSGFLLLLRRLRSERRLMFLCPLFSVGRSKDVFKRFNSW